MNSVENLGEVEVASNADQHAALAAELMARAIAGAIDMRGVACVALSGGSTPSLAYRTLAKFDLPWDRVEWFWVDERAVPPDHARANFRAAAADLGLVTGPASAGVVHRMVAEDTDLERAARAYQSLLRARFGIASAVSFDVMTLGIGDDGHTASLFPHAGGTRIVDRLVAPVAARPDAGTEARLTLTAPVIQEAYLALVLATGAKKRPFVQAARNQGDQEEVPARVFLGCRHRLVWLVDSAAAP